MASSSDLYNYFLGQGFSANASAAIVGNAFGESSLNASAIGDSGSAFGLWQIHPNYHPGYDTSFGAMDQAAFVSNELKSSYGGLVSRMNNAGSVADATQMFMSGYERPASMTSLGSRINAASKVLNGDNLKAGARLAAAYFTGGLSEAALGVTDGLGLTSDCNWLCQFRKWLSESHFWQRIGIGVLALIFIMGALYLFGSKRG